MEETKTYLVTVERMTGKVNQEFLLPEGFMANDLTDTTILWSDNPADFPRDEMKSLGMILGKTVLSLHKDIEVGYIKEVTEYENKENKS